MALHFTFVIAWRGEKRSSSNIMSSGSCTTISGKSSSTVHYLPYKINYDGQTEVNSYFRVKEDASGAKTAFFRGRELKGQNLDLDRESGAENAAESKMKGLVIVRDTNKPTKLEITSQFDSLTVWQHDRNPDTHEVGAYLDHLEVARAIHEV